MANYIRYNQSRLRDKSSLFFLSSFALVVVYTSVIGFVLVHALKITTRVEKANKELVETNQKLEKNLEGLVFRLEALENRNYSDLFANIGHGKRFKTDKTGRKGERRLTRQLRKLRQIKQQNGVKERSRVIDS